MENTSGTTVERKRGRPPKHGPDIKRHNVTVVMTAPMREAIRQAAEANGRSVSAEIDYRLGLSLELEKDAGGQATRRLLDFARLASVSVQNQFGHEWPESIEAASALAGALDLFIRASSPPLPENEELKASDREFDEITARLDEVHEAIKRREPDAIKMMREVVLDFAGHLAERETLNAVDRNRRHAGAKMLANVVRMIVGKEVRPDAAHYPALRDQADG